MRTKGITLGWLVMAAALTFCACSSEDNLAEEPKAMEQPTQATVIRVTVGAGISDGEGATRSTVDVTTDGETGKKTRLLQFTAGDQLYVRAELAGGKTLAGTLDIDETTITSTTTTDPETDEEKTTLNTTATFSGELTVYDGTGAATSYDFQGADPLTSSTATLLHAAMTANTDYSIDGATKALTFADATGVAATVEALMTKGLVVSGGYTAGTGYSLSTGSTAQPIVNCTIAGLEAGVNYKVDYIYGATAAMDGGTKTLAASMTADDDGTLAFVFFAETGDKFHGIRLTNTDDASDTYDATIGQKAFESKVYNAARTAVGKKTPLTLEAITDGDIKVYGPKSGMKFKKNGVDATLTVNFTFKYIKVEAGDKVQIYGNGTTITSYSGTIIHGGTAQVKVYGNIMSLVDETGFATATTLAENAFSELFSNYPNLKDASGLLLPATTLSSNCYERMFQNCANLTAAPALPATTLADNCYAFMFAGCTSLTAAPALPATTLASNCYNSMFIGCTGLTAAPALRATTLAEGCYQYMFNDCSNLTAVTCLATDISASNCTTGWLSGVAATGTFTKASTMTSWPSGDDGIPENWTVENAQ